MRIHTLRCFGAAPGYGNIAQVIENGPADSARRQQFARASGHSATVFVTPPVDSGQPWEADYFS